MNDSFHTRQQDPAHLRAEIHRICAEIVALLYSGKYVIDAGPAWNRSYYYCDGAGIACKEFVEGHWYDRGRFESEAAAMDSMLLSLSDGATVVASYHAYSDCRDENLEQTLTNMRHVRALMSRYRWFRYVGGGLISVFWPRRKK